MVKKVKGQGGITLVALVVTIVVLLILAGITIALVFADNGVVDKAQQAAADSNKGTIADNIQGYIVSKQMEAIQNNTSQDITTDLKSALTAVGISNSGSGTVTVNADTTVAVTGTITFTLGGQSYNFTAYTNGYPTLTPASDAADNTEG